MVRFVSLAIAAAIATVSVGAIAAEDPILTRKKIMSAVGASGGGVGVRMMREEIPFNPVVAQSVLRSLNAAAYTFGDYFPEGSGEGDTRAAPAIWENPEEFQEHLAEFRQATDAALEADPKDLPSFQAALGPVMQQCGSCHDEFRLEGN